MPFIGRYSSFVESGIIFPIKRSELFTKTIVLFLKTLYHFCPKNYTFSANMLCSLPKMMVSFIENDGTFFLDSLFLSSSGLRILRNDFGLGVSFLGRMYILTIVRNGPILTESHPYKYHVGLWGLLRFSENRNTFRVYRPWASAGAGGRNSLFRVLSGCPKHRSQRRAQ